MNNKELNLINPKLAKEAAIYLSKSDPCLESTIKRFGACTLSMKYSNPFQALMSAIVSQQLSEKAAVAIKNRINKGLNTNIWSLSESIAKLSPNELKKFGLSSAKANCLINIAREEIDGKLNFRYFQKISDEEVLNELIKYKGIGRWTAEMFLIFGLCRPNVLSLGDTGLRRAVQLLHGFSDKPCDEDFVNLSRLWHPYCSIASWYLWRALD